MNTFAPTTAEEASELIRTGASFRIVGSDSKRDFGCLARADSILSTNKLTGIVEYSPEDLVVVVRAGTPVDELQSELLMQRQWLPIPHGRTGAAFVTAGMPGTIGGLVSAGLPSRWDSVTRGVRYWVLGMTVVRANGEIAKCGSKAVKNVAGYDAQKVFTGAWGTLGLITEVILRVFAKPKNMKEQELMVVGDWDGVPPFTIARAPISESVDYASRMFPDSHVVDPATGTIWAPVTSQVEPHADGWAIYAGLGDNNWGASATNTDWMLNIKTALDPNGLFNPGKLESLLQ